MEEATAKHSNDASSMVTDSAVLVEVDWLLAHKLPGRQTHGIYRRAYE